MREGWGGPRAARGGGGPLAPGVRGPAAPARSGACFAAPCGGEVLVDGHKLVGSAQARRGKALLQHGSVLLAGSPTLARRVPPGPGAAPRHTPLPPVFRPPLSLPVSR